MKWPQRIFDCHSHWATRRAMCFRRPRTLPIRRGFFAQTAASTPSTRWPRTFAGTRRACLHLYITAGIPIEKVREYNDYTFDFARCNRDVVFGNWLNLDPRRKEEGLGEYRRALDAGAGFAGLAMAGHGFGIAASDPRWDLLYEAAIEANQPVMMFAGLTGIGQGMRGGKGIILDDLHPRHIDSVAARFPDLDILAARPAWPWQDEMIAVLLHKANVTCELHGWSPKYLTPALKKEIGGRLQDRVMFGCDFPVLGYERVLTSSPA